MRMYYAICNMSKHSMHYFDYMYVQIQNIT